MPKAFRSSGGATWTSYTLDPRKGLLYIPGGNPAPISSKGCGRDKSLLRLHRHHGGQERKLRGHYSLVPEDFHDWDVAGAPTVITTKSGRHVVAATPKNGMLYAYDLDAQQTALCDADHDGANAAVPLSSKPVHFCPGFSGGAEWNGPAYDPDNNLIYSGAEDWCSFITLGDDDDTKAVPTGAPWTGAIKSALFGVHPPQWAGWLMASDAETGKVKWKYKAAAPVLSGLTPTKGGLRLRRRHRNGTVFAFEAATGKTLWQTTLDGAPGGGLITYRVDGHQRVAVVSGTNSTTFPLSPKGNAKIVIFGL